MDLGTISVVITFPDSILNWCQRIEAKLDRIIQGEITMSVQLDNLAAAVANETTVETSVAALLAQLSAQIAANKTDPVAIQAIADKINANSAALQAAVVANTPAA